MLYPIKVSLDDPNCKPVKSNTTDAGWDLRSNNDDFTLFKGAKVKINTGVRVAIPKGQCGIILPRSGMGTKYRVGLANTAGVIDSLYRGEIIVYLINDGNEDIKIHKYDRFCQILFIPVNISNISIVSELPNSKRGENGFGSSGVK